MSTKPVWYHRFVQLLISVLIILGTTHCSKPSTIPPLEVVVVLMRHTTPYCPDGEKACEPWWPAAERAKILPPRHPKADDYETVLNQLINDYYKKATFGKVQFNFRVLANPGRSDGWWNAPHSIQEYNQGKDENGKLVDLHQDGVTIAYQAIGKELFNYEHLLTIQGYQGRGGQECGLSGSPLYAPIPCSYKTGGGSINILTSWISEDASDQKMAAIASHELGHQLGSPDQYNGTLSTWPAMGAWDLMDDDPYFNHFGGWTKFQRGWITSWTDMPCVSGSCTITTILDPLEYPGNNVLRIPFTLSPFTGYMAECRQKVNHDENLPEAGLLLTQVDESKDWQVVWVVSKTQNFWNATLKPGESYLDSVRKITISNISQPGDTKCTLKVDRNGSPAPDPALSQAPMTETSAYKVSQSPDIWIDSSANGWDVYPAYENWDPNAEHPVPSGFGDPYWVDHENRIGFRITNVGMLKAVNVVVNIYVRQPAVISSPCGKEPLRVSTIVALDPPIGSVTVGELGVGQYFQGYVPWTPTSYEPVEIRVVIQAYPGEVSTANNMGRETFLHAHQAGSLSANLTMASYGPLFLALPEDCGQEVPFRVIECVPVGFPYPEWQVSPDPTNGLLKPGESLAINLLARPPAGAAPGFNETFDMCVIVPVGDAFQPIGRLTFQGRVVDPAGLTCSVPREVLPLGSSVPVTGSLTPQHAGEILALEYRDPSGMSSLQNIATGQNGAYADQFVPTVEGMWTVQAYWQGSEQYGSAQSPGCTFTIGVPPDRPTFTPEREANCRFGPGSGYGIVAYAAAGVAVPVEGRDSTSNWYYVRLSENQMCWIGSSTGRIDGDPNQIPVKDAPPLPTPTPTPMPVNCGLYSTQLSCEADTACYWYEARTVQVCRNK